MKVDGIIISNEEYERLSLLDDKEKLIDKLAILEEDADSTRIMYSRLLSDHSDLRRKYKRLKEERSLFLTIKRMFK